jgi:hypothetical protein
MKILKKNIKANDIFSVGWKAPYVQGEDRNWCFEGYLIAVIRDDGELRFYDTYWGYKSGENKNYSYKQMNDKFKIKYLGNFDELEEIKDYTKDYYKEGEVLRISNQHACSPSCINYFVKKGTKKDVEAMRKVVADKIRETRNDIDSSVRSIERLTITDEKLKQGDTEVYI